MAEAKERNLAPTLPSDMQSVLKRCDTLEKEVRSLKLNLSFMNRYVMMHITCFTLLWSFIVKNKTLGSAYYLILEVMLMFAIAIGSYSLLIRDCCHNSRKDSEQTKQIEELQKENEDLKDEKRRLVEEIERIYPESGSW